MTRIRALLVALITAIHSGPRCLANGFVHGTKRQAMGKLVNQVHIRPPFGGLQESSQSSELSYVPENSSTTTPKILRQLNSSTKWLVSGAHAYAVLSRPMQYQGPFIVLGTILSVYLTDVLKEIFNQSRPEGAPLADPGMPSSHSLVSFFAAAAWLSELGGTIALVSLMSSAWSVAWLRVLCGYHSYAQIGVGAVMGSVLGFLWAAAGRGLVQWNSSATFSVTWVFYVLGSIYFIVKNMLPWMTSDRHL